ncbi:MAG: ABC transporter substrate-binding protein [Brevinema sp.]
MKKLLTVLFLLSAACASNTGKPTKVNLTYVKSPLNLPLILGYQKGIYEDAFKQAGITVEWHEINSGAQQTEAMAAGSVDFSPVLGGTSALLAAANGSDVKILNIFGRAPKAFLIMVKDPTIKTAVDLKGKTIAGPKGSVLHELLAASLTSVGLSLEDVTLVSMSFPEALTALGTGNIDGALLPSNVQKAGENLGARVLLDGEGYIKGATVTAVRGDFAKKNPELVAIFRKAHQDSVDYMNANMDEAISVGAQELGISENEVRTLLAVYDFNPTISDEDRASIEATQNFLIQAEMMPSTIDLSNLILP